MSISYDSYQYFNHPILKGQAQYLLSTSEIILIILSKMITCFFLFQQLYASQKLELAFTHNHSGKRELFDTIGWFHAVNWKFQSSVVQRCRLKKNLKGSLV